MEEVCSLRRRSKCPVPGPVPGVVLVGGWDGWRPGGPGPRAPPWRLGERQERDASCVRLRNEAPSHEAMRGRGALALSAHDSLAPSNACNLSLAWHFLRPQQPHLVGLVAEKVDGFKLLHILQAVGLVPPLCASACVRMCACVQVHVFE